MPWGRTCSTSDPKWPRPKTWYTFTQFLGISGGSDAGQITESSPIPPPAPVPLSGHSHSSNRHVTRWPSSAPLSKHSACKQRLASGLDKASQSFGTPTPIPQRRRSTRRPGHLGSHSTPTSRHDLVPIPSCLCFPICTRVWLAHRRSKAWNPFSPFILLSNSWLWGRRRTFELFRFRFCTHFLCTHHVASAISGINSKLILS